MSAPAKLKEQWERRIAQAVEGDHASSKAAEALRHVLFSEKIHVGASSTDASLTVALLEAVNAGDDGEWGEASALARLPSNDESLPTSDVRYQRGQLLMKSSLVVLSLQDVCKAMLLGYFKTYTCFQPFIVSQ